ncbi:Cyclin-A2-2 [Sesamum angolense]|uniref:Cyclin-A2-2 n=1 Tax=Sesamum angolense TaxID=2727404 RepID=A0AAE1W8T8_9LAMI|nr:Cyclin-A2-2 [Sesamum angolense]
MKHAVMNDENRTSNFTEPTVRITRARAKVLRPSNGLPPLYPSAEQDDRRVLRANSKRAASDNNKTAASSAACPQHKRRAVLKDVTNITCQSLYINCTNAATCQVVKMESRILNFLGFQLSVPTTKKFLRRFIQAAQVSYKVPSVELEFLANYLAELTLIEYSFLKFLPSLVAASAVLLARWTLDQSEHPWNPTLEHYTRYKTSELKTAVLQLQDLQLNTSRCVLNAIREKYKQPKFKCVSTLSSPKPVQSLF